MLRRRLYYRLKPFLPRSLRMWFRRRHARAILKTCGDTWPIDKAAGKKPEGWPGWPDGKSFAFVLTHDVESQAGVDQVKKLAEREMELGFRSSFNFIPEGSYRVPSELRDWLTERGFEVGVHDLHHDGHLFSSRTRFRRNARRINHYVKKWGASGFRAGFMLRNIEWLHELDVEYDASSFDTDPFEPQPGGAQTIFPFFVNGTARPGYVELPYTLPQDSTLFLLLEEETPSIWKKKLDWIVEKGGMALVNVHPDYLSFEGNHDKNMFPAEVYFEFLRWVRKGFDRQAWEVLPRDVAAFLTSAEGVLTPRVSETQKQAGKSKRKKIWIDLENTPHIPFFNPIIRELRARGYEVVLTARDAYQTCEMADLYGFDYQKIGHHYGRNKFKKVWGLFVRSSQLIPFVRRERPNLSLNHGSRTQSVISKVFRIPAVTIMDYEHSSSVSLTKSQWQINPALLAGGENHDARRKFYQGIKEDVYVPEFRPDSSIKEKLGLEEGQIVVTVRPPATEAHYHNAEADLLFTHFMNRATSTPGVKCILLPRNKRQEAEIRSNFPEWFEDSKTVIPKVVVDGLNLLWHSDLVVSGGGTMNREAAAMGIPVYSIFRGTPGGVDLHLQKEGRLTMIATTEEVDSKIQLAPRLGKGTEVDSAPRQALKDIITHIEDIIEFEDSKTKTKTS